MKIVLAAFGSLGDLHPKMALGLELKRRGYDATVAAMEYYREKIEKTGLGFAPMRPHFEPEDRRLARDLMDAKTGTEKLIKEIIMPNLGGMYEDLLQAIDGAELLVTGEVVYAARSVVEKTNIKWISTTLSPGAFLSTHDPFVPPVAQWYKHLRFMPSIFHSFVYGTMRGTIKHWYEPYKEFRRANGFDPEHDPIFDGKYSDLLHLALFSKALGKPQPDWHSPTLQAGFCFYDGQDDLGKMPDGLSEFLDAGEAPIVFTLGSAAVMDARDFFEQSAKAAKILKKRAVLIYGVENEPPKAAGDNVFACEYAPYSLVFPRAACVVHQGGVGTTGQVLRAGVPHLIMPYSHDQPDNAARCARIGVAETIDRDDYSAEKAAARLKKILENERYRLNAEKASRVVESEHGTKTACDAIESILRKRTRADNIVV